MEKSCGIPVKFPEKNQSFDSFKTHYIRYVDGFNIPNNFDGLMHVGSSVVLAPSKEAWEEYKREKLTHVPIAPKESYQFEYDSEKIKSLCEEYKISCLVGSSFVQDPTGGRVIERWGETHQGFRIDTVSLYENGNCLGDISVQEDTFVIYETINSPKIQPVIDFIENVMKRSGSASSAYAWLRQIKD